ncbi:MAG: sulfite exporter TauE/SafE family protein [Acidimicrobiia bacterium]
MTRPVTSRTRLEGRPLYAALAAVGLVAGVVSGLLGVGGGIVMVPLMAGVLSFRQHVAHATSLAAIVVIALSGALGFGLAGQVDLRMAALILVGGLLGAYLGARSMHRVSERTLKLVFGGLLVAVGVRMVIG